MFVNEPLVPLASDPEALIVHPHAQRTGGGTLRNKVLAAALGRDQVYSRMFCGTFKPWAEITDDDLKGYRAYTDHADYCDLPLARRCLPIALLRDPVQRAVSLYSFCRRRPTHEFHELAMNNGLEDFYKIASGNNPRYFRNVQSSRICNRADARVALEYILTRYLAVGFTRHLDTFAKALSAVFGWSNTHVNPRPDRDRYGSQITPAFRDMVLSQNHEDRLLFDAMMRGAPYRIPRQPMAREIVKKTTRLRDRSLALARGAQRRIGRLS